MIRMEDIIPKKNSSTIDLAEDKDLDDHYHETQTGNLLAYEAK